MERPSSCNGQCDPRPWDSPADGCYGRSWDRRRGSTRTRVPASSIDRSASLNVLPVRVERLCDDAHDHIGEQILSSDLHDARPVENACSQNCREVTVVGLIAERELARWNSTEVYAQLEGRWRIVHSHWSYVQAQPKSPGS